MPITLDELIRRVPPETEDLVRRAKDRSRSALQEALRLECRLQLRTTEGSDVPAGQSVHVPVEILPGCPTGFGQVEFPEEYELVLLLSNFRTSLEKGKVALPELRRLLPRLEARAEWQRWVGVTGTELQRTESWVEGLLKILALRCFEWVRPRQRLS